MHLPLLEEEFNVELLKSKKDFMISEDRIQHLLFVSVVRFTFEVVELGLLFPTVNQRPLHWILPKWGHSSGTPQVKVKPNFGSGFFLSKMVS